MLKPAAAPLLAGALAAVGVVVGAGPARAQVVNVQSAIGDELPEGLSGAFDASVDWRTGNVVLLLLSGAATLRYRAGDDLVFAVVKGDHGRGGRPSKTLVSRVFEHVRYRHDFTPRWTGEVFAQHEADEFRRLRVRALAGAGPRVLVAGDAQASLHAGLAYMLELEELRHDEEPDAGARSYFHRASSYLVGQLRLSPHVQATETVYAQPRLDEPRDLRLLNETAILSALGAHVRFKTSFTLAYDSRPPSSIRGLESALQIGVSLAF